MMALSIAIERAGVRPRRLREAPRGLRVEIGALYATPGALAALVVARGHGKPYSVQQALEAQERMSLVAPFLARHVAGDWGDVSTEDARANELALIGGERILSAYRLVNGERIWIIAEADRSSTTVLLPDEY